MQFAVSVPITMHVSVLVEADNEDAAKAAVFRVDFGFKVIGKDKGKVEIVEWLMHRRVAHGKVYSGVLNEICTEAVD